MGNSADPDYEQNFARSQVNTWRAKFEDARARGETAESLKAAKAVDAAESRLNEVIRKSRGK